MTLKAHLILAQLMESTYYVNVASGINTISCTCLLFVLPQALIWGNPDIEVVQRTTMSPFCHLLHH